MSKINVQMTQPKYVIKPKDGIVICSIIANGDNDCYGYLYDVIRNNHKLQKKYGLRWINNTKVFTAVTKLHKEDEWDEIKGKRIAESKCKRKIYKFYLRLYSDVYNELMTKDIELLNQHRDNLFYCIFRETNHLNELMQ